MQILHQNPHVSLCGVLHRIIERRKGAFPFQVWQNGWEEWWVRHDYDAMISPLPLRLMNHPPDNPYR